MDAFCASPTIVQNFNDEVTVTFMPSFSKFSECKVTLQAVGNKFDTVEAFCK